MSLLAALWLPIVLSTVIVFFASSVIHMLLPYHRGDYKPLPEEDKVVPVMRTAGLTRGLYIFPYCTHKEMKSPAMIEKYNHGPVLTVTVCPSGQPQSTKVLGLSGACCIITAVFVVDLVTYASP